MASVTRPLARRQVGCWPQPARHVRRFHDGVANPLNRVQIYTSRCTDPWINLSVEHFLLQRSAPDATVLFLYTNRPCVVMGRNQNPWLEVDLGLVNRPGVLAPSSSDPGDGDGDDGTVALVRRRSGGGTVFHDAGNVNYCVICPPAAFDRDRHAEMVVRALRGLSGGGLAARVNERHDIVLDVAAGRGPAGSGSGSGSAEEGSAGSTFKISGSAYKLTRQRSLHHGTCLLSSPNLQSIGRFLRSPAAPFIMARGVESVRSKITNVGIQDHAFREAVIAEFGDMYESAEVVSIGAEEAMSIPEIVKGHNEIKDDPWTFGQTPLFTFSTHPAWKDKKEWALLHKDLPSSFEASVEARHGQIVTANISGVSSPEALKDLKIYEVDDWRRYCDGSGGAWLNKMFGKSPR